MSFDKTEYGVVIFSQIIRWKKISRELTNINTIIIIMENISLETAARLLFD